MNLLIVQTVCYLFIAAIAYVSASVCNEWTPYRDKKCIKLINKTSSLLSYDDAEKTCASNEGAKLTSILSQEEQTFLENYLFKQLAVVDNIWLGARADSSHAFHWKGGHPLNFTHWAPGNPKAASSTDNCLQMHAEHELRGRWSNEPCGKKNLVVCERRQSWNLDKMQEIIEKLQEAGEKARKASEEMAQANKKLQEKVDSLAKNPVPLGFIYVQLPKQKSPQEIWPLASWTDDSAQYDSAFFRVAGSKAEAFGRVQEEFAPYIDRVKFDECKGEHPLCPDPWNAKALHTDGWSEKVMSSSLNRGGSEWYHAYLSFHTVGGEIRPRNMAAKVWRRSA